MSMDFFTFLYYVFVSWRIKISSSFFFPFKTIFLCVNMWNQFWDHIFTKTILIHNQITNYQTLFHNKYIIFFCQWIKNMQSILIKRKCPKFPSHVIFVMVFFSKQVTINQRGLAEESGWRSFQIICLNLRKFRQTIVRYHL
jgi:hypothetical protein